METKIKIKQILADEMIKTRLLKIIKVPQEPVKEILNSASKVEIQEITRKESKLVIDLKISLHIIYIPQGIGELKRTFSVSFNFLQELCLLTKEKVIWPLAKAEVEGLVIKPQGKNLLVIINIATKVLAMGLKDYRISEKSSQLDSVSLAIEDVEVKEDFSVREILEIPFSKPWLLVETYPVAIEYKQRIRDASMEVKFRILARIMGFSEDNPKPQSQYQLIEFSMEKTIEGWESQKGLSFEPQFYRLDQREKKNGFLVLGFEAVFTMLKTIPKIIEVNLKDTEETKDLVMEKPILRKIEEVKLESEVFINSAETKFIPEVFVWFTEKQTVIQGVVCLKKYIEDDALSTACQDAEYIPFKVESKLIKNSKQINVINGRVRIERIEQITEQKVKGYLTVILDLMGSELRNL